MLPGLRWWLGWVLGHCCGVWLFSLVSGVCRDSFIGARAAASGTPVRIKGRLAGIFALPISPTPLFAFTQFSHNLINFKTSDQPFPQFHPHICAPIPWRGHSHSQTNQCPSSILPQTPALPSAHFSTFFYTRIKTKFSNLDQLQNL